MLDQFNAVWSIFQSVIEFLPGDIVTSVLFVFCSVGVVGILRSF